MAELNLKISIKYIWIKEDGDCSECAGCKDLIFGNKYTWSAKINGKGEDIFNVPLCESCADEIKNK